MPCVEPSPCFAPLWLGWIAAILGAVGIILGSIALAMANSDDSSSTTSVTSFPGQKGEPGQSITGQKGAKGATGPAGCCGPCGPCGPKGGDGTKGEKGQKGEEGGEGREGADGAEGQKGEEGGEGRGGADGAKGQKGEKGEADVYETIDLSATNVVSNLTFTEGKIRHDGDHMTVYFKLTVAGGVISAGKIADVNSKIYEDLKLAVAAATPSAPIAAGLGLHFLYGASNLVPGELHSAFDIPDGTVIDASCTFHGTIFVPPVV